MNGQNENKNSLAVTLAWRELACAIFRQAVYDVKNPALSPEEQQDAVNWLQSEGYEYLTNALQLEMTAGDYFAFIERVQESEKPIQLGGQAQNKRKTKKVNHFRGLYKLRAPKNDNQKWQNCDFLMSETNR